MNTTSVQELLKKVYHDPQPSIIGCQMLYLEAINQFIHAEMLLEREQCVLVAAERAVVLSRLHLYQWHRSKSCSLQQGKCRSGACGCSYGDLVKHVNLVKEVRRVRQRVSDLRIEAEGYHHVANHVIAGKCTQLIESVHCEQAFIEMAHFVEDISDEEKWLADNYSVAPRLSGTVCDLRLTIGRENPRVVRWNIFSERVS